MAASKALAALAIVVAVAVAAFAVYTFGWKMEDGTIQWDPMHGEPLQLVPEAHREEVCAYLNEGRDETWNAPCVGTLAFNSLYGHGIVDALAAVTGPFGRG